MFQQMKKRIKNEKGLTLIELLAVIVILAIVAAIAIPAIGNIIENSRSKAVVSDAINVMNSANMYFTDNSVKDGESVNLTALTSGGFLESAGKLTEATVTKNAGANSINFKAPIKGKSEQFTATLQQLTDAKVEKGVIKLGTDSSDNDNDNDNDNE